MSDPIQAAEDVLAEYRDASLHVDIRLARTADALEALLTHARTLEAELARLREPLGDGAELVSSLEVLSSVLRSECSDACADCVEKAAAFITRQSAELARKTTVADAYWEIIESFKKENAELRAALKPFAEYHGSDEYLKSAPDDGLCAAASFTAGDYRKARALAAQDGGA